MPSSRTINLFVFTTCAALIAGALYMQHSMGLTPCYLCITQRAFVILVGVIALIAFLHNPAETGQRRYGVLVVLSAISGAFFSIKQLWLQSLPEDRIPACGPPADYLFDAFPFQQALSMLLRGDGNCAKVQWALLGISIPGWVLAAFIGFIFVGFYQVLRGHCEC